MDGSQLRWTMCLAPRSFGKLKGQQSPRALWNSLPLHGSSDSEAATNTNPPILPWADPVTSAGVRDYHTLMFQIEELDTKYLTRRKSQAISETPLT